MLTKFMALCGLVFFMIFAAACGDNRGSALSGDPQGTVVPAPSLQAGSAAVATATEASVLLPAASGDDDDDDESDEDDDDESDED